MVNTSPLTRTPDDLFGHPSILPTIFVAPQLNRSFGIIFTIALTIRSTITPIQFVWIRSREFETSAKQKASYLTSQLLEKELERVSECVRLCVRACVCVGEREKGRPEYHNIPQRNRLSCVPVAVVWLNSFVLSHASLPKQSTVLVIVHCYL